MEEAKEYYNSCYRLSQESIFSGIFMRDMAIWNIKTFIFIMFPHVIDTTN